MGRLLSEDYAIERYRKSGSTYYFAGLGGGTGPLYGTTANRLIGFLFYVPVAQTFNRFALNVTTTGSGAARLGMYVDDGSIAPGKLILDAGTVDLSTTGIKTIDVTLRLSDKKLYWTAFVCNVVAEVRGISVGNTYCCCLANPSDLSGPCNQVYRSFTYGNLPDPFGTPLTLAAGDVPGVFLRRV